MLSAEGSHATDRMGGQEGHLIPRFLTFSPLTHCSFFRVKKLPFFPAMTFPSDLARCETFPEFL